MTLKDYITTFLGDNAMIKVTLPIDINNVIYEVPVAQNITAGAFKLTEPYMWDLNVVSTEGYANQLSLVLETQSLDIDVIPEPSTDPDPNASSDTETDPTSDPDPDTLLDPNISEGE